MIDGNKKWVIVWMQIVTLSLLLFTVSCADEGDLENFKLSADSETVVANYDKSEKLITISGEGTILESKWTELARAVSDDDRDFTIFYSTLYKREVEHGWLHTSGFRMEFQEGSNIKLQSDGFMYVAGVNYSGFGWFQDFGGTIEFNKTLDTSDMTDMSNMFERATNFNDDITYWKTSNVTTMKRMFDSTARFSQNLDTHIDENGDTCWDVSNVENMQDMFRWSRFDGSINNWTTDSLINMQAMFEGSIFNRPVNHLNVNNVTNMMYLFFSDRYFNQDISAWQTTSLLHIDTAFKNATSFNQNISNLNLSKVISANNMFCNARKIKHINLLSRANSTTNALASDILTGTDPYTVKFDKLREFTWTVPRKYRVESWNESGDKQATYYIEPNASATFEAGYKYELYGNFDIELATGVDGDSVTASYDAENKKITINGSGTILQSKWEELAHNVEGGYRSFTEYQKDGTNSVVKYGWQVDGETSIEFTGADKSIKLETAGYNDTGYGWFMDFPGTIEFNGKVDTSEMTHMTQMFHRATKFNGDISDWNTGSVENMKMMFSEAAKFNKPINTTADGCWNVSNVEYMGSMFEYAGVFNQDISNWNTGNVTNMHHMFQNASAFNQDISSWDVSSVQVFTSMFLSARSFNQPIGKWNTKNAIYMHYMLSGASAFNQNLNNWDTSNLIELQIFLDGATSFNNGGAKFKKDLSGVKYMEKGFRNTALKDIELNRIGSDENTRSYSMLDGTKPDTVKFNKFMAFDWKVIEDNTDYWVRIADGKPKLASTLTQEDDIAWDSDSKTFSFSEGVKYELAKKEIPYAKVTSSTVTYTGSAIDMSHLTTSAVDSNGTDVEGNWTLEYIGDEAVNVGTYQAVCRFTPDDLNTFADTRVDVTVTVTKADPVVVVPSGLTATYGDTLQSITLTNPNENIEGTWSFVDAQSTAVGKVGNQAFVVLFTPKLLENYNELRNKAVVVQVNKKALTMSGLEVEDKIYDGDTTATVNYTGLNGRVNGETSADVDVELTATFNDENVGEDKPVTITATLKGGKADNYSLIVPTDKTASIRRADFNIVVPEGLRGWQGGTLSEVRIPVVDGGVWTFDDESAILSRIGKHRYNITFTPSSSNFKVINTSVDVEVLEYTEEKLLVDKKEKGEEESTEDILEEEKTTPESSSNSLPFDDVEKSDWYHDSVKKTYENKILKGTSEKKFSPKLKVTRGMMITSTYNMNGKEDVVETSDFSDIAKDSYYEKAVNWGQKNSIVKGYGKDFRPDKPILRQEMVAMLYRYRNCDCYEHIAGDAKLIQEFKDASEVSSYARDAMDWALSTGLVIGRSEDVLAPKEVLTRAELATILERFSRLAK